MERINELINIISLLILVTTFILVANKRVNSYIRTFRLQSLLLALLAGVLGIYHAAAEKKFDGIIIICLLTIALKVIYIPGMLDKIVRKVEYRVEKDFFVNIPLSIIISCVMVMLTWYVVSTIRDFEGGFGGRYLIYSISVVWIGLFFMISRKKAIGQIIGFLVIENGMFLAAILMTSGMPMIVELGIFFDVLTAALIMGIFVFRINETFEHINIRKLKNLRG
jgi:hydrogenase-4 component E